MRVCACVYKYVPLPPFASLRSRRHCDVSACVYICVYVGECVCVYKCVPRPLFACRSSRRHVIYVCVYICMYVCMCVCVCVCACVCRDHCLGA